MRTITESFAVSDVIDKEQSIYPRLEDAFDALKWWLAHEPQSGEIIDDENVLYKQKGDKDKNIPALVVIYTFSDWEVLLKFILVKVPTL